MNALSSPPRKNFAVRSRPPLPRKKGHCSFLQCPIGVFCAEPAQTAALFRENARGAQQTAPRRRSPSAAENARHAPLRPKYAAGNTALCHVGAKRSLPPVKKITGVLGSQKPRTPAKRRTGAAHVCASASAGSAGGGQSGATLSMPCRSSDSSSATVCAAVISGASPCTHAASTVVMPGMI